jgi:hypothetical protein
VCLGTISALDGIDGPFAGILSIELGRTNATAPDHLVGLLRCSWDSIADRICLSAMPLGFVIEAAQRATT